MARSPTLSGWLKRSRKSWALLAQAAVWLSGLIGTFLASPPPSTTGGDTRVWLRFGQFLMAALVGLLFLAAQRWRLKKHLTRWAGTAVLFLCLGSGAFFTYQYLSSGWTCIYDGNRVLVGGTYTAAGRAYVAANPGITCAELLRDAAGRTEAVWERSSVERRGLWLAGFYILCIPLFTVCVMALLQALGALK